MKNMKKLASLALALMLLVALCVPAMAAETHTITITPPAGTGESVTNEYKVYKVFDAVGNGDIISYKLMAGKNDAPAGFSVDAAGNVSYSGSGTEGQLTADDIAAIAAYVENDTPVTTVTSTGTDAAVAIVTEDGYYYITTSNGTAVTVNSTNPTVEVKDKNEVPTVKKEQTVPTNVKIGDTIDYTITIAVKAGAESYVLHDTMGEGLTLNPLEGQSDKYFTVKVDNADVEEDNYTATTSTSDDCSFEISFTTEYLAGIVGKDIVVTYSAIINDTAAIPDGATTTNIDNTVKVTYGEKGETPPDDVEVELFKFDLVKTDKDKKLLDGAVFELYSGDDVDVGTDADGKPTYTLKDGAQPIKFNVTEDVYKVSAAGSTATITVNGKVTVEGLKGTYYLKETKAPNGYNLLTDLKQVEVTANNPATVNTVGEEKVYQEGGVQVVNNAGATLPSTGGIGTTIFYIVGGVLVIGAVILLVTRKRVNDEA